MYARARAYMRILVSACSPTMERLCCYLSVYVCICTVIYTHTHTHTPEQEFMHVTLRLVKNRRRTLMCFNATRPYIMRFAYYLRIPVAIYTYYQSRTIVCSIPTGHYEALPGSQ